LKIAEDFEKADRKNIFREVLLAGGLFGGVFAGIIRKLKPGWGFERPVWWSDVCEGNAEPELNEQSNDVEPETNVGKYGDLSKYDGRSPTKGTVARPWSDIVAPLTNPSDERDSRIYNAVLNQFGVESNSRYKANQQGKNETYCNIYVWDVTKAMGAEIPHWVDRNGNPVPQYTGRELNANGVVNWLETNGNSNGWHTLSAEQAQSIANSGKPVVATYDNPNGIGHVAMVRPGEYSSETGPAIAQAGSRNMNNTTVRETFGSRNVVYYYHE
jgi:hypothetical protein